MRSLGYAAEAFASAADVLASPRLAESHCLIADVNMPAMTGVELTLVTREWPKGADGTFTPLIVNPSYVGRTMRDATFARGVCTALAKLPGTLVQSHERIDCCDIYRAGDGVHAVWVDERMRGANSAQRLALAASPYHRYMIAAE